MNPDDLVKAAPEIAKVVAAVSAAVPFTAIFKRMLGPAADELAEMWRDQVRLYRYERQLKCVEKAEKMANSAGFTPQAVPPKILFPLLEGASFEESERIHDMWAALLANASSPNSDRVRPGFIATLKQMARDEAVLLDWMFSQRSGSGAVAFDQPFSNADIFIACKSLDILTKPESDPFAFGACLQSLHAAQLIEPRPDAEGSFGRAYPCYSLTFRGLSFIFACRPPQPQK